MIDFKIQRGPSDLIFSEPGVVNPRLIIEEGCWYLCTDTAELFLGIRKDGELTLKRINEQYQTPNPDIGEPGGGSTDPGLEFVLEALKDEIAEIKEGLPTKISQLENDSNFITLADVPEVDLSDYAKKSEIPSLKGYATEQYVIDAIANQVPIEELAKKEDVEDVKTKVETVLIPKVEEEIVPTIEEVKSTAEELKTWVENKEYLQHIDLDGYATKQDVADAIANIDIPEVPEVNLDSYYTKTETLEVLNTALGSKANEIPFITAKFVKNPIGSFTENEDISGLTLAELFAKLLGLSDDISGENPEEPEVPGEDATPEEIVDYLIATNTTMYSQDKSGNLVETPFIANTWTKKEAAAQMDGVSTIYHIEDDSGNVIESGYQEATDYNEEAWLTIALPDTVKNVKVKMYNPGASDWEEVNWTIVPADEQTMEGYTIWTVPEQYEVMSGDTYRFVIIE